MKSSLFIQLFLIICCKKLIYSNTTLPLTFKTTKTIEASKDPCYAIESAFKSVTEVGKEVIYF